jgi:hypothetical protein
MTFANKDKIYRITFEIDLGKDANPKGWLNIFIKLFPNWKNIKMNKVIKKELS